MISIRKTAIAAAAAALAAGFASPAFATAPAIDKGDTAWMLTSSLLVLVMTQVGAVAALTMIVWVGWGYTEAFGDGGNAVIAGFGKAFLHAVTPTTVNPLGATIPEYVYCCFQMTFAAITIALVLGSVVE